MGKRPHKRAKKRPGEVRHYVKQWRKHRRLTQEQLAGRVERSRGLIGQIEIGETELTEEMIYALASALTCAPWDILRVNPLVEGEVVDITDRLRDASPEVKAEALGFVVGLTTSAKH